MLRLTALGAVTTLGGALALDSFLERDDEPTPEGDGERAVARRLYSDESPWNTPLPHDVPVHPRSEALVGRIVSAGHFGSDPTQYTYPVYVVGHDTPTPRVRLTGKFSYVESPDELRNLDAPTLDAPIPDDAVGSSGSDGSLILLNADTGEEWGFWRLHRSSEGLTAVNGYRYSFDWSGVPPRGHPRSAAGGVFVSRGAGLPYAAGLIRPWEVEAGRIEHALAFAYNSPSSTFVFPATKSDGRGDAVLDLPEGSRLQLDPTLIDLDFTLLGLSRPGKVIARALQRYGMIVVDNSGHPKVMAEDATTARWGRGRTPTISAETVGAIPLDRFRVVDWNRWTGGDLGTRGA